MKKRRNCTECNLKRCQEQCGQERKVFPNSIAKAVYEARDIVDLSQKEFAFEIGIKSSAGQSIISMLEKGVGNRKPTSEQALAMSRLSGISIERFIEETDDVVLHGDSEDVEEIRIAN